MQGDNNKDKEIKAPLFSKRENIGEGQEIEKSTNKVKNSFSSRSSNFMGIKKTGSTMSKLNNRRQFPKKKSQLPSLVEDSVRQKREEILTREMSTKKIIKWGHTMSDFQKDIQQKMATAIRKHRLKQEIASEKFSPIDENTETKDFNRFSNAPLNLERLKIKSLEANNISITKIDLSLII